MTQIVSQSILVRQEVLLEFVTTCFEKSGLNAEDALLVATSLVESNLRGIDSHGVARLAHYLNRIRNGSIQTKPELIFSRISPALGRLDGDHGMGQIVMQRATQEAIAIAREAGAGWVAVENSTHCGALAFYGLQITSSNMIGLVFTHSDSMVVPYGAKHPFCGTNPLCFTAPGENHEALCLDMATSIVPWNTISNAAIEGVDIPEGWAVDASGDPTTNPKAVHGVHPFGGYKGSGLGLMIDLFCSFLLGSPYGPDIGAMYGDPTAKRQLGGLVGAIDVSRFGESEAFRARVKEIMERWNAQKSSAMHEPVLYPGQPESLTRTTRLKQGIPIGINVYESFQTIARELNIPFIAN